MEQNIERLETLVNDLNSGINNEASMFKVYEVGQVAKDKPNGTMEIEYWPVEKLPNVSGKVNEVKSDPVENVSASGSNENIVVSKGNLKTAEWLGLGYGGNRVTAPDVVVGEYVLIYTYGNMDKYFWDVMYVEQDIRKHESVLYMYSNKQSPGGSITDQSYFYIVDTLRKYIRLHTAINDGEPAGYDLNINTKEGTIKLVDTLGNSYELLSVPGIVNVNINNDINITNGNNTVINTGAKYTINCPVVEINASTSFTVNSPDIKLNGTVHLG